VDNREAKELRMTVVLRGSDGLDGPNARQALTRSVDRLGHELGASAIAVTFPEVPAPDDSSEIHETDVDWMVE